MARADTQTTEKTALSSTPSIHLDHRHTRSFRMACAHFLIKPFRPRLITPPKKNDATIGSPKLSPHSSIMGRVAVEEQTICDVRLYQFAAHLPGGIKYRPKHDLYYFAGGSFVMPASKEHWSLCCELTEQLPEYRIHLVSCPLAPLNRASQALPILRQLALELCARADKDNRHVTFAGDSTGGNIAMSLGLFVGDETIKDGDRRTQLKNILLISPAIDLRKNNPDMIAVEKNDPIMTLAHTRSVSAHWVDQTMTAESPALSPILADLTTIRTLGIKVHGVVGTYDILSPDAIAFRRRLEDLGIAGEWLEWDKQMHCFPLAAIYPLPEAKKGMQWILDVLRNNA